MTLETSWREAEDRAAASQFELERVKRELEEAKMQLLENRR
jgi:bHLH factor